MICRPFAFRKRRGEKVVEVLKDFSVYKYSEIIKEGYYPSGWLAK
jgi:hypothetical protein